MRREEGGEWVVVEGVFLVSWHLQMNCACVGLTRRRREQRRVKGLILRVLDICVEVRHSEKRKKSNKADDAGSRTELNLSIA